jgi:hypothetical protein
MNLRNVSALPVSLRSGRSAVPYLPAVAAAAVLMVGLFAWAHEHDDSAAKVRITERDGYRHVVANGLPDHRTGKCPNRGNPNRISAQKYAFRVPLSPEPADGPLPRGKVLAGVALNGVPFDPGTAEGWTAQRARAHGRPGRHYAWRYEALTGGFSLGLDRHHAHVQPNGAYHYHALPNGLYERLAGRPVEQRPEAMVLLGYAADGYPMYGPWAHEDPTDATSALKKLKSSCRVKKGDRPSGADSPGGRYDVRFTADWEFVKGHGDLDKHNGRFGVTPQHPAGTYYYVITDTFPFVHRGFQGAPDASFVHRGGPPGRQRGRSEGGRHPSPPR